MKPSVVPFCLLLALTDPNGVQAGIGPSFHLDACTTRATHIVVIDQIGRILESHKGDLKVNDVLPLESLKLPTQEEIAKGLNHDFNQGKRTLSDSRRILFLIKEKDNWKPATRSDKMYVSMAWQEGEKIYVFKQLFNPGPTLLHHHELTSDKFFARLKAIVAVKLRFDEIQNTADTKKKATALSEFLRTQIGVQHQEAIKELARCGQPGEIALEQLLDDARIGNWYSREIILAYAHAAGKRARPRLMREVKDGLSYWQKLAPSLEKDWWNKQPMHHGSYTRLMYSLEMLARIGIEEEDREPIQKLLDFWKSQPALEEVGQGLNYNSQGKLVKESQIASPARRCLETK